MQIPTSACTPHSGFSLLNSQTNIQSLVSSGECRRAREDRLPPLLAVQHLWWEGASPPPEAAACAAGHIRRPPAPRALAGAIFSVVAHAICACHFSLTMRCQSKGPGACCYSSFPLHTNHLRFGDTLTAQGPKLRFTTFGQFCHLKQTITKILLTRLIKSLQPRLTTG